MASEGVPLRAGCYCRISSDPDDKREGVDRQRKDTAALCELKGWSPVGFYVDNDRSASNGKARPEWERLLTDIETGKLDAIAAWDQDRGWRMMHELEALRRFFAGLGREIKLATTGQGEIDLYSPTGVMMAQVKTAVSEHEVAMLKVRIKRAAREKAELGRPSWKRAFGYLPDTRSKADDDGTRQVDPATAPLVAKAYRALLSGTSISDIARMLNTAGAFGLNGKPWTASTVSLFLRAPRNAGLRSHNNAIVGRGTWPPLVSVETWRAAQAILNQPGRAPGRKTCRQHLLTQILKCGNDGCGGYLNGYRTKAGGMAYRCRFCFGVAISAEHVTPLVYGIIAGRLAMDDAQDLLKAEHDQADAEILRVELSTLYGRLTEIGAERGEGLLTGVQAKAATDVVAAKIAELESRQRDAERVRVFADLPLGTPKVAAALEHLSHDRFRAIADVLATFTVAPVGKGHRVNGERFDADRVSVAWHRT